MIDVDSVAARADPDPVRPVAPYVPGPTAPSWITRYLKRGALLAGSLVLVGAAMAWNLQGYPGRVNDDEGTYVDRGWAMLVTHHLSNYTYYWDHPVLGWATIAAWAGLTDGFARDARSVMVGRELMWVATMVSCVLLYVLARRIDIQRPFAALAVVLFGASPLDIWYHRMVSLDNLATVWALAALVLAASRRRSWGAAIGSGACFAVAFWNKETILLLFPAMLWLLYQHTDPSTRFANVSSFCVVAFSGIAFYPLLAILKGELMPGPGHDSLWKEQVVYQLTRPGTGSVLNKHSGTFLQFHSWVTLDPWLILGGGAAVITGLVVRRLRPFALGLILQLAVMVKGGYVPYAFVTAMLPFAALLIAGTADAYWRPASEISADHRRGLSRVIVLGLRNMGKAPVTVAALVLVVLCVPHWYGWLRQQSTDTGFATEGAAVAWVADHVPRNDLVVCDAYPWLDIALHTHATPLYLWQIDSDPQVMRTELPHGYRDISYLLLDPGSPLTFAALPGRPTLQQAIKNSTVVQRFGSIVIYKVRDASPGPRGSG
ncbi:MAG TPA: glycosyltransferase family 39 protein [Streptosporangiaceae bacterium]|nr:glycosyltransferase family 39 protein [Streptosporangiaceae bacterium]